MLIDCQQSKRFELRFFDLVLILFVKHEVQNFLCFHVSIHIGSPYLPCSLFVFLFVLFRRRNDHYFFKGIVKMLLIIVEWRVFTLFYLLLLLNNCIVLKIRLSGSCFFRNDGPFPVLNKIRLNFREF